MEMKIKKKTGNVSIGVKRSALERIEISNTESHGLNGVAPFQYVNFYSLFFQLEERIGWLQ